MSDCRHCSPLFKSVDPMTQNKSFVNGTEKLSVKQSANFSIRPQRYSKHRIDESLALGESSMRQQTRASLPPVLCKLHVQPSEAKTFSIACGGWADWKSRKLALMPDFFCQNMERFLQLDEQLMQQREYRTWSSIWVDYLFKLLGYHRFTDDTL